MGIISVRSVRVGLGVLLAVAVTAGLEPAQAMASPSPIGRAPNPATPQQAAGTAAGRAHQVQAAATGPAKGAKAAKASKLVRPKGAVPKYVTHTPQHEPTSSGATVHSAPAGKAAPARKSAGFNARTSIRRGDLSSATTTVFENTDGTFTAQIHQAPINKQAADGTWVADPATPALPALSGPAASAKAASAKAASADAAAAITNPIGQRTTSGSTYVKSGVTQNFSSDNALYVGSQGGYKYNSFLKFDSFASQFTNAYVISAKLYLDTEYSGLNAGICDSTAVSIAPVTGSWSPTTLKTFPGPATGASIGTASWSGGVNCANGRVWGAVPLNPRTFTNWAHGWAANNGLAVTAPYTDASFKEFNPDDAYLSIEYAADNAGASYAETLYASPWNNKTGWAKVTVQNEGSATWTATNGYRLGYEIYTVSGTTRTLYSTSNYLTTMPGNVAPNKSVTVTATLPALTPGPTYQVCWDMVFGSQYFSGLGIPQTCYGLAVVNNPPIMDALYPYNNSTQYTLTPNIYVTAHDVDAYPGTGLTYTYNLYAVGSTTVLATSGAITTPSWIVPAGKLSWGSSYYWTAQVSDGNKATPWSQPAYFSVPSPAQPLITSHLGAAAADATLDGVNPAAGNYSTSAVDITLPGPSRGPVGELRRTYNSVDPRGGGFFGAGWSSLLDTSLVEDNDGSGSVVVEMPDGHEERFGKNADGTYKSPPGSREILTVQASFFVLIEPSGLNYKFMNPSPDPVSGRTVHRVSEVYNGDNLGVGIAYAQFPIAQPDGSTITELLPSEMNMDPFNRGADPYFTQLNLQFTWGSGRVTTSTGKTIGVPHITQVIEMQNYTNADRTWAYNYDTSNDLTSVCPPANSGACTSYAYNSGSVTGSHFSSMVLDSGPQAYWRLSDAGGATTAADQVAVNVGTYNATPTNVTFGQPGAVAGSPATSAAFNGTSAKLALPNNLVAGSNMTVGMWFKTTQAGGTLFSYQGVAPGTATSASYVPAIYVGTDGKVHAQFWNGTLKPMASAAAVNDGKWHFVVLSGAASTQTLYVDGAQAATLTGSTIAASGMPYVTVGAGEIAGSWPNIPSGNALGWFSGQIQDAFFLTKPLGLPAVQQEYSAATVAARELVSSKLPSGKTVAALTYDALADRVTSVANGDGGTYQFGGPVTTGSTDYYRGAVLSTRPTYGYPLNEDSGAIARNLLGQNPATDGSTDGVYNDVVLGTPGIFGDSGDSAGTFNGTSSYLSMPSGSVNDSTGSAAVGLWFRTTTAGGTLFSYQSGPVGGTLTGSYVPALYVGNDGKLRGQFWDGTLKPMVSTAAVNDGNWHMVLMTAGGTAQTLWLDGISQATRTGAAISGLASAIGATTVTVGAGYIGGAWPVPQAGNPQGYFNGQIAEAALYALNPDQYTTGTATYLYRAKGSSMSPMPTTTVSVTDPVGGTSTISMDPGNGMRTTATTNSLGQVTRYTYDTLGNRVGITDPDGHSRSAIFDSHSNAIQQTTCQTASSCQSSYYSYYWRSADLSDPNNGKMLDSVDARAGAVGTANPAYRTTYAYNATGELVSVTTPPTTESPNGHKTTYTYTTSTTKSVGGNSSAPAGLLQSVQDPLGRTTTYEYESGGELGKVTEPSGQTIRYGYSRYAQIREVTTTSDAYPDGKSTWYTHDGQGRLTGEQDPTTTEAVTGRQHTANHTLTYDVDGNLLTGSTADLGQTVFDWAVDPDYPNAIVQKETPVAGQSGLDTTRTNTYAYNAGNRIASVADPQGRKTSFSYNGMGWRTGSTSPDGTTLAYGYSSVGDPLTTTLKGWTGDPTAPTTPADLVLESRAYDPAGRLASVTDAMGRTTGYTYFDDNHLQSVTNAVGTDDAVATTFTYDVAGNRTGECDGWTAATGCSVQIQYTIDAANRVTRTVQDPSGANVALAETFNANDDVLSAVQTGGGVTRTTTFGYDSAGRLTSQAVNNGSANLTTTMIYDQRGLVTSATDPRGYPTTYRYDEAGRQVGVTSPPASIENVGGTAATTAVTALTGINTFGEVAETKSAAGTIQTNTYDTAGQLAATAWPAYTPPGATAAVNPRVAYAYDTLGRLTTLTDPLGNAQTYTYDQLGNQVATTLPDGRSTHTGYDADGEVLSVTDATGARTEATYNALGLAITATQIVRGATPAADTATFSYDPAGNVTKVTDPLGHASTRTYDHLGRAISSTDAVGDTTSYAYNLAGQITKQTAADGTGRVATYDLAGRLTGLADQDSTGATLRTAGYTYDEAGNPTSVTDPLNKTTTTVYDALDRVTSQTQPGTGGQSITTRFGYNADRNKTRYTDPNGNVTTYTYNVLGLPESTVVPAVAGQTGAADRTTSFGYDADGRLTTTTRPGNVTVTSGYDKAGRLTAQSGAGADAVTAARSFTYDGADRLLTATSGATTDRYTYDDRGLLLTSSMSGWNSSFGYDAASRMTSQTDSTGTTGFGYDDAGRQTSQNDPLTGATVTVGYNKLDQPSTVNYGTDGATRAYSYDSLHQLTSDVLKNPSGATEASVAYSYDLAGHVTSKNTTGVTGAGSNSYSYDDAGRLSSWTAGSVTTPYTYDPDGNRTRAGPATYTYNARSQLTTATSGSSTTSYSYTPRGTTAAITAGTTTNIASDAFDQQLTYGSTGYSYDALGRLASAGSRVLSYDDQSNNVVSDGSQTFTRTADGTPLSTSIGGAAAFLNVDRHGDVTGTFTASGSSLTGSTSYDPYGAVTATTGARSDLGYQGGWTDAGTGFVSTASRWYNPGNGNFTSADTQQNTPDPAVNANPYAYGNDDPLGNTDPTGHDSCTTYLGEVARLKAAQYTKPVWDWGHLVPNGAPGGGGGVGGGSEAGGGSGGTSGGYGSSPYAGNSRLDAYDNQRDRFQNSTSSRGGGSSGGSSWLTSSAWGYAAGGVLLVGAVVTAPVWGTGMAVTAGLITIVAASAYTLAASDSTRCTATNAPTKPRDKAAKRTRGPADPTSGAKNASQADPDLPEGARAPQESPDSDTAPDSQHVYWEEDGCTVAGLKRDGQGPKATAWDCSSNSGEPSAPTQGLSMPPRDEVDPSEPWNVPSETDEDRRKKLQDDIGDALGDGLEDMGDMNDYVSSIKDASTARSQASVPVKPPAVPSITQVPNAADGIDAGSAYALMGTILWAAIKAARKTR
ncbi:LamG-like jellyroll fold domain-containing protein [Actinoplanes sp. NPDC026619]|uniref:LamG-like jellyroll fold domain-containing protein n=1 Tax=Actinoplanes sp. NPDC026619 TaxID=3155798 RepID=UPI00340DD3CE